jgi:Flp pilus assembly protein TadD
VTRLPLLCGALALLVYLPSLAGGFLYDDQHVVVDNIYIRDLRQPGVVLSHDPARPLLGLSWALNYALAGLRPWPYHLVNVLLHAGNAALVASLFLWMAGRSPGGGGGGAGGGSGRGAAALGACIFAASPMAAETVAYVSSRSTALATLFGLASLRLAVGALEGSGRRLLVAVAFYVAALATKEEAAAVPLLLLLLDFFFVAGQRPRELVRRWRVHLVFLGLTAAALIARRALTGAWLPAPAVSPLRYAATQLAVFPLYFLRALVPLDPALYRGVLPVSWPPSWLIVLGWTGSLALVAWALAVAWLIAGLLPSSSIVALREMAVDHRAYLGSVGVCFALGSALWRPGRGVLAALVVAVLAARAVHYQWVLADPARAWQDAVSRAPLSVEAWLALGEAYSGHGDARAEGAFQHALSLDPRDARSATNLGAFYAERGRIQEAEGAMRQAARAAPFDARIRDNLGMILSAQGRLAEARAEFEAAVAGRPTLAQPRLNLAMLLMRAGELPRARALVEEASRYVQDPQENEAVWELRNRLRSPAP